MMQFGTQNKTKFVYILFISLFAVDFFTAKLGIIPRIFRFTPELLSFVACLVFLRQCFIIKSVALHPKYVLLTLLFCVTVVVGNILNETPSGAAFFGVRTHFKHFPIFFLPAFLTFSEDDFTKQLKFLMFLLVIQLPVTIIEKIYYHSIGNVSGDPITGTLSGSGTLTIVLISSIAIVFSFFLTERMKRRTFFFLLFSLFLPTAINETKITIFLLPLALIIPTFFIQRQLRPMVSRYITVTIVLFLTAAIFVPAYNYLIQFRPKRWYAEHDKVGDYFDNDASKLKKYFYSGTGTYTGRRGDAIVFAFKLLSEDVQTFFFGIGIGNASESQFQSFGGESDLAKQYGGGNLAFTLVFWELGFIGVILYIAFFILIFRDTFFLRNSGTVFGCFALGWCAVIPIMVVTFLCYTNMIIVDELNYLFWYFSGVIASMSVRMRQTRNQESRSVPMGVDRPPSSNPTKTLVHKCGSICHNNI